MNALDLGTLLADPAQAGAYFVDDRDTAALAEAAETLDYEVVRIDLRACAGKSQLLEQLGEAMRFPDWFGNNWDALADALTDLSWWPANGYLLLLEHSGDWQRASGQGPGDARATDARADDADDARAADLAVLLDILNETARAWAEQDTAFWSLLPLPAAALAALQA